MASLLNEVHMGAGLKAKPSVSFAKTLLRERGAKKEASRLGKVIRLR